MKPYRLKSSLLAIMFSLSAGTFAADNGLIAIITLHTIIRFLKRKPKVPEPKPPSWATPRWWPRTTMMLVSKIN
ncbi:D-ribose ABC transporter substrate-binding protein [Pectobacterium atrosepticum]|nr:D-ribose ABC transporter substrate-binding protein [Pectobacterium atrosepticum]